MQFRFDAVLILAAGLVLATATGCRPPAPLRGTDALTTAPGLSDPRADTSPPAAVATVVGPDGERWNLAPSRLHVLSADGTEALAGSVVGTGSVGLEDTVVFFTDPEDRYYVVQKTGDPSVAALIAPLTDDDGRFTSPAVFPAGTKVLATALLSGNRRLLGSGMTGGPEIRVSPGSTCVIEFLRDQTGTADRFAGALASSAVQDVLRVQGGRADELMGAGLLPAPTEGPDGDLLMGNGARLASKYVVHAIARDRASNLAWRDVFDAPVRALTTFAGNFKKRFSDGGTASPSAETGLMLPAGITQGAPGDDAVYIAEIGGSQIKRAAGGFIQMEAGKPDGDPNVVAASLSADVSPIDAQLRLGAVHEVQVDAAGNLAVTFADLADGFHVVGLLCRTGGQLFGREMTAGKFYRLSAPDGLMGYADGTRAQARFRSPSGIAFDDAGNLFVADRRNNRIRRIDRQSGEVTTVLGDGWPWLDGIAPASGDLAAPTLTLTQAGGSGTATVSVPDMGRLVDRPAGTGSGLQTSFNRPLSLAWRQVGANQELYIYDSYNNVVRLARAAYPGSFRDAEVKTIAGTTRTFNHATRGYSVTTGTAGPVSEGLATQVTFNFARYEPDSPGTVQLVRAGLALDAQWNRLYVADSNNAAIRMLDLDEGKVFTIAAADPTRREGDARRVVISNLLGRVAVLRDHSVLFADYGNHVVRQIHTQHDR